jgi:hypothetical protein
VEHLSKEGHLFITLQFPIIQEVLFIFAGPPNEVERLSKEGQRGGHAEDGHAESAGWSQDRPRAARKGLGRHEGDQDKVGVTYHNLT